MKLGFTVDELVMAGRRGAAPVMGLMPVPEAGWLYPGFDRAARAAAVAQGEVRSLPQADEAVAELCGMLGAPPRLADAGQAVWEDLCLLLPGDDGRPLLVAGVLAHPTDWRLADKMGQPLGAIHAPVHGYAGRLAAGVDHFAATLRAGAIHGRANAFIVPTGDAAYRPTLDPERRFAHVDAANAGETLFVRCERQTLRRLPRTGAIIFTIGVATAPLGRVGDAALARLAHLAGLPPPGAGARAAAPHYAAPLIAYAAARTAQAA